MCQPWFELDSAHEKFGVWTGPKQNSYQQFYGNLPATNIIITTNNSRQTVFIYIYFLWLFCMDFTNLFIIYSTDSFPGLWEVPMIDYIDLNGKPCNMIDGCSAPANEQETYELLSRNFDRHYNSNRAPFPMFMHAVWFAKYPYTLSGKSMKYTLV